MTILNSCFSAFTPTPDICSRDWFIANLFTHEDTGGRPYDDGAYPHIGAPGGPCDVLDDQHVENIILQWASRLGKSFFGQSASLYKAEVKPGPMMHANADEKTAKEVVQRTYGMMNNTRCLRKHLKPERRRRQDRVDYQRCKMYVAWARSVSTLADKAVEFGHGGEIDKWEHQSTSNEADPLQLFLDRGKEFPTRKFVLESTPTVKGKSRVEHLRLQSTNCRFYVPCPHCGKYQVLAMDRVEWDKNEAGKSDKDLARKTARYNCIACEDPILDHHRAPMMRRGVWCPEGCTVNDQEAAKVFEGDRQPWRGWSLASWIEGTPARDGGDAGYQLSSLYALSLGWGDVAAKWVSCQGKPQDLRNFINQWLAETWEEVHRKATWEQVGARIIVKEQRQGVVPLWASLVTVGVDKQADDRYPYVVDAWGPGRRSATIAYGECESLDQVGKEIILRQWPHEDGGASVRASCAMVDSGHRPKGVYDFVIQMQRQGVNVLACKGSNTELNAEWRRSVLGKDTNLPGMELFLVDTIRTQLWIDQTIHDLRPEDPGGSSLYFDGHGSHQDFLQQLINDAAVEGLDSSNNIREKWRRINEHMPNDYRDCRRYSYVAMLVQTRGAEIISRRHRQMPVLEQEPSRIRPLRIRGR